jgi:hypothetical protein
MTAKELGNWEKTNYRNEDDVKSLTLALSRRERGQLCWTLPEGEWTI